MAMSDEMQALCFLAGANSIFYGPRLLTTPNPERDRDRALMDRLGLCSDGGERTTSVRRTAAFVDGLVLGRTRSPLRPALIMRRVIYLDLIIYNNPKSGCSSLSPRSYEVVFQSLGASIRVHAAAIRRGGARS